MMEKTIKSAVVSIEVKKDGETERGTGFFVTQQLILTAFHVIADIKETPVKFYEKDNIAIFISHYESEEIKIHRTSACVHKNCWNKKQDWVLLKCHQPQTITPLSLKELEETGGKCQIYGFPDTNEYGIDFCGEIRALQADIYGIPAIHMFSEDALGDALVKGFSGSPLLVDNRVVGVMFFALMADIKSGQARAGALYARSIKMIMDHLVEKCGEHIPFRRVKPSKTLPNDPYLFTERFTEKHAEIFFGRDQDIHELFEKITFEDTDPIILLYGQSGVGKSSFLDAGLKPQLQWGYEVFYKRRDSGKSLSHLLQEVLGCEQNSLRESWCEAEEKHNKPLIIILDQVEEVYISSKTDDPQEMINFLNDLQQIFPKTSQKPKGKLILSFRKEFLAEIQNQFDEKLPFSGFFLPHLNRSGIIEIVKGLTSSKRLEKKYNLAIDDPQLPATVAEYLLADNDSPIAPSLQILLTKMWKKAKSLHNSKPKFTRDLYNELKCQGPFLEDFVNKQLEKLQEQHPDSDSGLVLDILLFHTTHHMTSLQRKKEELEKEYKHCLKKSLKLVADLKNLYLLADPPEDCECHDSTRLSHDTIGPIVHQLFMNSDKAGQRARRILENKTKEFAISPDSLLSPHELNIVDDGIDQMRTLRESEEMLVEISRENIQRESENEQRNKINAAIRDLSSADDNVKQTAIEILKNEEEKAVPFLLKSFCFVREDVSDIITNILSQLNIVSLLTKELENYSDKIVKLRIINILGAMGNRAEEAVPNLKKLVSKDDKDIEDAALEALGQIGLTQENILDLLSKEIFKEP